jgi:hypothetical protein
MHAPEEFGQRAVQQSFKLCQLASQAIDVRDQLDLVFQMPSACFRKSQSHLRRPRTLVKPTRQECQDNWHIFVSKLSMAIVPV